MKKRTFLLALVLTALVFVGYAVAAGGDASDPLVSLDFLNGTFRRQAEERIDEAVTKADAGALDDAKARWNAAVAAAEAAVGSDYAAVFTETRVKQDDILSGVTGLQVIPLAGELTVSFSAGTVVDVTDGRELTSGSSIPINHRCLVAEDTTALFTCTSKTAVLSYCGSYHFALSDKPDRNAMAEALQSLSLFRGTGSGIGSGYELEKTPTRAEALIMLIRMLGEEKAALAGLLVDEYAKRFLPEDTARFAYLLSRLKKSMTGLLCYLRDEQNQSRFRPVACELKIGSGADAVPGQLYHLSDGRTVQLIGTVDRADEWVEEDGTRWVRVVDYKTGTKKLDLKEVYCGLDCQMLLYLFSLTRDPSGRFTGAEPAGVLYLLADPAPETTTREKAARSVEYQLDGLVRDEQKVFDAMDADETGRYLPFGYRNGAPSPYQKDKRADIAKLNRIRLHLDDLVTRMGEQLYGGQIAAEPLVVSTNRSPCAWCDYDFICCHETGIGERGLEAPAKPFEPEAAEDEEEPT